MPAFTADFSRPVDAGDVAMMQQVRLFAAICLLRAGPQDLPASRVLLGFTLGLYLLLAWLLAIPAYGERRAVQVALLDTALLVVWGQPSQTEEQVSGLLLYVWLLLLVWNLLVAGHILRHALSTSLGIGTGVSLLYALFSMQLVAALFPYQVI